MAEEFNRNNDPRNMADTAVAMVHSTKAKPVRSALERRSIRSPKSAPDVPDYGDYIVNSRDPRPSADWLRTGAFLGNHFQIIAIIAVRQSIDDLGEVGRANEFHPERDLFETRDLQTLSMFDGRDVIAGFEQT